MHVLYAMPPDMSARRSVMLYAGCSCCLFCCYRLHSEAHVMCKVRYHLAMNTNVWKQTACCTAGQHITHRIQCSGTVISQYG